MKGGRTSATVILAVLVLGFCLGACAMTSTPAPGLVWPTTSPATSVATLVVATPPQLPTPTARSLSPTTPLPVPLATFTPTGTLAPIPLATATATSPADTATPVPPTATATAPPPTDTATPVPPATAAPATATPVRGKLQPTYTPTPEVVFIETATATLTVTPTATSVPTLAPTAPPTPVPTPSPAPAFPVADVFRSAWRDYPSEQWGYTRPNPLGQPLEAAQSEQASRQFFGTFTSPPCTATYVLFLWLESAKEIYFLVGDNVGATSDAICVDRWESYPDTWTVGQGNNEDLQAPPGMVTPVMGFGRVWRQYFYGKSDGGLGFAIGPEMYTTATVQRFEHGTALFFPDTNEVYVLFPDYHALGIRGEFTYRAWFRNP